MRAVWIRKSGGPDVLEVRETPDPEPKDGEVRIRVKAAGLNFAEISARQGIYPAAPKPPCIVGYEGSGTIDRVSGDVGGLTEGERVLFLSRFGGHSDTVCVPAHQAVPIPDAMSFEHAAALPVNYLTAYQLLFIIRRIRTGDRVLIHAAAGGVGTAVLQLCRTVDGVTTFGTASAKKHDYLRSQGCHHPIDYRSSDYVRAVRELTNGEGVDLVCDALGGADWSKGYSILRPGGILACFGFANTQRAGRANWFRIIFQWFRIPRFNPFNMMGDNRGVSGLDLGSLWGERAMMQRVLREIVELHTAGKIEPHIDAVIPFDRAKEAHLRLETGANIGKVLLVP